jgi:hypothetical protein
MLNPFRSKDFKKLKDQWYEKLKEEGFQDIEDTSSPREFLKKWHSTCFKEDIAFKESHYYQAANFLNQYIERRPIFLTTTLEIRAWELYAEGLPLRDIATQLQEYGFKANKDLVNKIVNEFKKKMKDG